MCSGPGEPALVPQVAVHSHTEIRLPTKALTLESEIQSPPSLVMDRITKQQRSQVMRSIRSKDTGPEMTVRKLCHCMGYRFRLHKKELPGSPDLVFPSRRAVIFVHGCFWHQHPSDACPIRKRPKSRVEYWNSKLDRNVARDQLNEQALKELGWNVLTIWECETKDLEALRSRIRTFLNQS